MAFRHVLRRPDAIPVAAGVLVSAALFHRPRDVFAEEPAAGSIRKPIYDAAVTSASTQDDSYSPARISPTETAATSPTPTDRLTESVRTLRVGLYKVSSQAETSMNQFMSRVLSLEDSFTSTIASLAPPSTANEALMPGLIYVLVAAMAGNILTRNRGILLRFTMPLALGIGTGYAVIPVTMRNVGDLVWSYEKNFPEVAQAHLQIRDRAAQLWETSKAHTISTVDMAEQKVNDARGSVQDWVKQGK